MYSNIISQNIRWLRHSLKLSQEDFSKKLGIKRGDLSNWELGRNNPKLDKLKIIAEYFNLTVDALMYQDLTKTGIANSATYVEEDGVLYGLDPMMKDDERETPEQAAARIAVLKAYIKTLSKENEELKEFIESNLKIKI